MAFWDSIGKAARGAYYQINPFDRGLTYSDSFRSGEERKRKQQQQAPRPQQPQNTQYVNGLASGGGVRAQEDRRREVARQAARQQVQNPIGGFLAGVLNKGKSVAEDYVDLNKKGLDLLKDPQKILDGGEIVRKAIVNATPPVQLYNRVRTAQRVQQNRQEVDQAEQRINKQLREVSGGQINDLTSAIKTLSARRSELSPEGKKNLLSLLDINRQLAGARQQTEEVNLQNVDPIGILEDALFTGGKPVADLAREFTTRGGARIVKELDSNKLGKAMIPFIGETSRGIDVAQESNLGKFIFGRGKVDKASDDIKSFTKDIPILRDVFKYAPLATVGGIAINLPGIGGTTKVGKFGKAAKELSLVDNTDDVVRIIGKYDDLAQTFGAVDDTLKPILLERLAKETKPKEIQKTIRGSLEATKRLQLVDPKVDPLESLKQEARKYKSAEEFVNSKINAYRATSETYNPLKVSLGGNKKQFGTYVTNDLETAKAYLDNRNTIIDNLHLTDKAKVATESDLPKKFRINELSDYKKFGGPQEWQQKAAKWAKDNGYDVMDFGGRNNMTVVNPEALKTKQQLTDLYNQATAPQVGKNVGDGGTDLTKYSQEEIIADSKRVGDRMAIVDEALKKYPSTGAKSVVAQRQAYLDNAAKEFDAKYGTSFNNFENMQKELGHFGETKTDIGTELLYKQLDQQNGISAQPPKTVAPVESKGVDNTLDELQNLQPEEIAKIDDLAKQAGFKGLDDVARTLQPRAVSNIEAATPEPLLSRARGELEAVPAPIAEKNVLKGLSSTQKASTTEGALVASQLERKAKQLKVSLDQDFIYRYQTNSLETPNEQAMGDFIKQVTDPIFEQQKRIDPSVEYRKNYVPQSFKQDGTTVEDAIRSLNLRTGSSQRRTFQNYREAQSYGLTPKYATLDQMVGTNAAEAKKALGNIEVVQKGIDEGIFNTARDRGWSAVEGFADEFGSQIYAPKATADKINGVMQEITTGLPKLLAKSAKVNQVWQDIMLAGGIPYTPFNMFVINQGLKDLAAGRFSAVRDVAQSFGKKGVQQRFIENKDFVRKMAERGLDLRPHSNLSKAGKGNLTNFWGEAINRPTFERYMPLRYLSTSENVYKRALKKGLSEENALQLAADTTKKFYGAVDQIARGRSRLNQDAISTLFFAPHYRESVINTLFNTGKSVVDPRTWSDPAYALNRRLAAGMTVELIAMDQLNRQINGHSIFGNREGQELSLQIPYGEKDDKGNQKVLNLPFMSGFMTIPRSAYNAVQAALDGRPSDVVGETFKTLSTPLQTAGRVIQNQDYFGKPIYTSQEVADQEGVAPDKPLTAGAKIASYVFGQAIPSYGRAIKDALTGQDKEKVIAQAAELPIRFGKVTNPDTVAYFNALENARKSLNGNDKNAFNTLFKDKKNVLGQDIASDKTLLDGAQEALILQNNPKVQQAVVDMYNEIGEKTGKEVDPLYKLSPLERDIVLKYTRINNQDPGGSTAQKLFKDNREFLEGYYDNRNKYFDNLMATNPRFKAKSEENQRNSKLPIPPEATSQVDAKLDKYSKMKDGAEKASFLEDNPEVGEFFEKSAEYKQKKRKMLGLPEFDDYPKPNAKLKKVLDTYYDLPKNDGPKGGNKTRSLYIKSHPELIPYWIAKNVWTIQDEAQLGIYKDEDLSQKSMASISGLAKNLKKLDDGTWVLEADGGGSGYGSGGGKGGKGGGKSGKTAKDKRVPLSSLTSYIRGLGTDIPDVASQIRAPEVRLNLPRPVASRAKRVKINFRG